MIRNLNFIINNDLEIIQNKKWKTTKITKLFTQKKESA